MGSERRGTVGEGTPGRGRRRSLAGVVVAATLVAAVVALAVRTTGDGGAPADDGAVIAAEVPVVLVFSRTEGYRHPSIGAGVDAVEELGDQHGFVVEHTEDPDAFTPGNLARFAAVVWLSTTGDVLDPTQQAAFEGYVRAGGGYAGIHAASDTEYGWPWYGRLVGAWFDQHPPGTHEADVHVEDGTHPSTAGIDSPWTRTDEWYDFRTNPRGTVHVLATLDEATYSGGGMGSDHPIVWCQVFDGGRSWYTAMGHTASSFDEPRMRQHLAGGIRWAAGMTTSGCGPTPAPPPPSPSTTTPSTNPTIDPPTWPPPAEGTAGRFVPVPPARVLDTRIGLGATGALGDDDTIDLAVGGQAGVPAEAMAVAVTLTATDATAAGYVTAWPTGELRPTASHLNVERAGQTIAALAVVRVGVGGSVSLYAQSATHLLADVAGYWVPSGATAAGRFVPTDPARLVDTRVGQGAPAATIGPDAPLVVDVAGRAGLPASGIGAVVLNLTATGATGPGYLTAWGSGERPLVSNLNVERAGQTIPDAVVVPVGPDGRVRVFAQTPTHVVVDLAGWFTDESAPVGEDGRFVPVSPTRLLDTRTASVPLRDGQARELFVTDQRPVPFGRAGAVLATLTGTEAAAPGYVSVFPRGSSAGGTTSSLNLETGQTIANLVAVRLGTGGVVQLMAPEQVHVVVDVAGWFTGSHP